MVEEVTDGKKGRRQMLPQPVQLFIFSEKSMCYYDQNRFYILWRRHYDCRKSGLERIIYPLIRSVRRSVASSRP
jgi:hypothetical protein